MSPSKIGSCVAANSLLVLALAAVDKAVAILQAFPDRYSKVPRFPSIVLLIRVLFSHPVSSDGERIRGLQSALHKLRQASHSFHLASSFFDGRLRIDLVLL